MEIELTADDFYRRRDDRTNRCTNSREYQAFRIRVTADEKTVETFAGQAQLLLAANMLARWCRDVEFGVPDAPLAAGLRINGWATLQERISAEVSSADPFGRFVFQREPSPDVQYTLSVGQEAPKEHVAFSIDANGWKMWASGADPLPAIAHTDSNPIGPAFAACIGVADAFKAATGQHGATRIQQLELSLLDFETDASSRITPDPLRPIIMGNAQVVGVGSVGSAAMYLLRMLPIEGRVLLIDHDLVEIENLNRSPLFGMRDIGKHKATVAAEYLTGHLPTDTFEGLYSDFISVRGRKPGDVDVLLPMANEYGVRRQIENNYPPVQVYGTTTRSWGINYHRHIPLVSDCSVCRFPEIDAQAQLECSTTEIEVPKGKPVDAALPFLSVGAAVLAVGDLIKLQFSDYPYTPNFAFLDLFGKMETVLAYSRRPKAACICANRSRTIHSDYLGSTRYIALSTA